MGIRSLQRGLAWTCAIWLCLAAAGSQAGEAPRALSADATVGELLDNDAARAVLQRHVPALVDSPQIGDARGFSLRAMQAYAPASRAGRHHPGARAAKHPAVGRAGAGREG